jgi:hypothetical protein
VSRGRSWSIEQIERAVDLRKAMPKVAARAINRTLAKANTVVVRALTQQTGLPRKTIKRAVKSFRANERSLTAALKTKGGNVNLRFFKARETRAGVSAAPLGKRIVVPHAFMKAGHFPNRVRFDSRGKGKGMDGNVFIRAGSPPSRRWTAPIEGGRSGVYIPTEMLKGQTLAAFDTLVGSDLPVQIDRAIGDAFRGF